MKALARKLGQLKAAIEEQRGPFTLFVLVLPEEAIAWDLLVSAQWMDADQASALRYLVKEVQRVVTKEELLNLSGILIFDSKKFPTTGTPIGNANGQRIDDVDVYGRHAEKAYFFVAPAQDFEILAGH